MNNLLKRIYNSKKINLKNNKEKKELVDLFIEILIEELTENGEISMKNFGKIYIVKNKVSNLRKLKENNKDNIYIRFKPSVNLKKKLLDK